MLIRGDVKELARRLSCSPQLINSWIREPETETETETETDSEYTKGKSTGKLSFLDRRRKVIAMVIEDDGEPDRAYPIGHYFASLLEGTFVPDLIITNNPDADILKCIGDILKDTGKTIETERVFWYEESPGQFTRKEKAMMRADLAEMKNLLLQVVTPATSLSVREEADFLRVPVADV